MEKPKRESNFEGPMGANKILSGMNCGKRAAFNGKTQAKIDIWICEASMSCRRGAALNGKTQARIKIFGARLGANKGCPYLGGPDWEGVIINRE